MEDTQGLECRTRLRLPNSGWVDAGSEKKDTTMGLRVATAADIEVDKMDTVCMNDEKIFDRVRGRASCFSWAMGAKRYDETQVDEGFVRKITPIPSLGPR